MQTTDDVLTVEKSQQVAAEKTLERAPKQGTFSTIKSRFGDIKINPNKVISFPHGLLGLPSQCSFYLADFPTARDPFKVLQSADDEELSFIVVPSDRNIALLDKNDLKEACNLLEIDMDNLLILLIVTVHRSPEETHVSVNLRAPVFIDTETRTATQYVFQNTKYAIQHRL